MSDTLEALLATHPDAAPTIGAPDRPWLSFGGFRAQTEAVRSALHSAGIGRGDRVAIVGNVHTVTELLQGTPEMVRASAQRCIDQAGAGGGFLLGSGCIVPRYTPLENVRAMVEVAHGQGYPVG